MAEVSQETKQFCPNCKTVPMQFRDNKGSSEWVCPQCRAVLVRESGKRITRNFLVEGYLTGDGDCFCIHPSISVADRFSKDPDERTVQRGQRIYPDQWFDHLNYLKKYRFRIHIDAEEVES